jgi:hypothetical protein
VGGAVAGPARDGGFGHIVVAWGAVARDAVVEVHVVVLERVNVTVKDDGGQAGRLRCLCRGRRGS